MLGNLITEAKLSVEDEYKTAKYGSSSEEKGSEGNGSQEAKAEAKNGMPLSSVTRMMESHAIDAEEDYNENHLVAAMSAYLVSLFNLDSDDDEDAEVVQNYRRLRRFEDR